MHSNVPRENYILELHQVEGVRGMGLKGAPQNRMMGVTVRSRRQDAAIISKIGFKPFFIY